MGKKILIIIPHLKNKGGIANYYRNIKLQYEKNIDYLEVNSYKVRRSLTFLLKCYFKFLVKLNNYSIIQLNPSLNKTVFWRELPFVLLSKIFNKKLIIFFRGGDEIFYKHLLKKNFYSRLFNLTYTKADIWILLGKKIKEDYQKIGKLPAKVILETTIAEVDEHFTFNKKINLKQQIWNILFLSRIDELKGTDIAIDTFMILEKLFTKLKINLFIVGDGPKLSEMIRYANGNERIKFFGYKQGNEKFSLIKESHIFFLPTTWGEGMPNSILEAMAFGLPIISRINAGIPDVVENCKNGFLTESIEPMEFIKFFKLLFEDFNLYNQISFDNYNKARNNFIPNVVKNRILKIYDLITIQS